MKESLLIAFRLFPVFRGSNGQWFLRSLARFVLIGAIMSLSACDKKKVSEQPIMGNQGMYLSAEQILTLEAQARAGSDPAAIRLSNFYYFFDQSPSKALFWAHMGASRGGVHSQYQYGAMIGLGVGVVGNGVVSPEERSARLAEGYKWFCLSARQHMPAAADQIRRIYGENQLSVCLASSATPGVAPTR